MKIRREFENKENRERERELKVKNIYSMDGNIYLCRDIYFYVEKKFFPCEKMNVFLKPWFRIRATVYPISE